MAKLKIVNIYYNYCILFNIFLKAVSSNGSPILMDYLIIDLVTILLTLNINQISGLIEPHQIASIFN